MRIQSIVITLALTAVLLAPAWAESPEVQLQRAIERETVSGDLKAAINDYKKKIATKTEAVASS